MATLTVRVVYRGAEPLGNTPDSDAHLAPSSVGIKAPSAAENIAGRWDVGSGGGGLVRGEETVVARVRPYRSNRVLPDRVVWSVPRRPAAAT